MQEILQDVYQHLYHLLDISDFTSVRAKCIFGTLKCVGFRINVSVESLDWLIEHNQLLLKLCECFHLLVVKKIDEVEGDLDIPIAEFLEEVHSSETEGFLSFCQNLQAKLQKWKEKVDVQDVTERDINHLKKHHQWFNDICKLAYVINACIDEQNIGQLGDGYESIKNGLSYILLQHIPGHPEMKW